MNDHGNIECLCCVKGVPFHGRRNCPECGHVFQGNGWDGIDAHWKSPRLGHEHIMPYREAWPIIRDGGRPSNSRRAANLNKLR